MNKYLYRVYDCNGKLEFVGTYESLNMAKNICFSRGLRYNTPRYYVIEVFNNFINRVSKVHYSRTSVFVRFDMTLHQICLDYGKTDKHSSYMELEKK